MDFSSSETKINRENKSTLLEEISPGCFFYRKPENVSFINKNIIDQLLFSLDSRNLKLGRICLHKSHEDTIQVMIIALHQDYLVNYHYHNGPEILKIIQGKFYEYMKNILLSERCRDRGLFKSDNINTLLDNPNKYYTKLEGNKLWHLTLLERWLQLNVDE